MMTVDQQENARARRVVQCLPMTTKGEVSPDFVIAVFGPLVAANRALPAPDHPAGVYHSRNALRMAIERQGRADTTEDWLSDQAVIDRELRYLASHNFDPIHELEHASSFMNKDA
jgi:hypothetical protein